MSGPHSNKCNWPAISHKCISQSQDDRAQAAHKMNRDGACRSVSCIPLGPSSLIYMDSVCHGPEALWHWPLPCPAQCFLPTQPEYIVHEKPVYSKFVKGLWPLCECPHWFSVNCLEIAVSWAHPRNTVPAASPGSHLCPHSWFSVVTNRLPFMISLSWSLTLVSHEMGWAIALGLHTIHQRNCIADAVFQAWISCCLQNVGDPAVFWLSITAERGAHT